MIVLAALGVTLVLLRTAGHPTSGTPQSNTSSSIGVEPGYEQLSPAQRLDRSLSLPGMQGNVRGIVGPGTVTQLSG